MNATKPGKLSNANTDSRKIVLYVTLAVIVVAIVVAVGFASRSTVVPENATKAVGASKLKVGDTAPQFTVATDAGTFDLNALATPVLLEVFAPWCPHCQHETEVLNSLATTYAGKLAIVSVSGDPVDLERNAPESQANVNAFIQQYNVRYPVAFDQSLKVATLYLKSGFPSIYVIDKNKKIRFQQEGEVPKPALVKAVQTVL